MHYLSVLIVGQHMHCASLREDTLYSTSFINITVTHLCKHMMSQFDDRLIIGYGKTIIVFFF